VEDLTDLLTPWCVHTVATLKIAERIDGVAEVGDLAAAAECDREALHDVLSHLVSKGVFEEPSPGRFALNDAARELFAGSAFLSLDGIGGRMAYAWSTLPTYVKTGRPGYADVFGLPFWEDLAAHPDVAASFDDLIGPGGHGTPDARFDLRDGWEGIRTVADVGGGTGAMLRELLRIRPELKGVLVDLPGTVARAEGDFERAGQSFFDPLPPADLYVVRHVLNDWPLEDQVRILRNCRESMARESRPLGEHSERSEASGRAIVVIGGVRPDDAPRQLVIETVLLGGRTSGLAQFRELARDAGLEVVAAGEQPAGYVVECVEN
jgi:2,7-dihydroxy-5-methyl-1-naphthoate 7-O-methyltransferase